ncbi:MAG: GMP/IMP nucleotidase [Gammaproteobacteria bacterium]|nr:GMP/IMP nucleotidase [Gammaproteobacteria bacterium]
MTALNWQRIDTVLFDMDGTLLDLHFDNHFWQVHVPQRFAEKHDLSIESAREQLIPRFRRMEGRLEWYCVDYWSEELGLDIALLKAELSALIRVHPDVVEFLEALRASGRRLLLVTNAHTKALDLKMRHTGLEDHFDQLVSAHDFDAPKEDAKFWIRFTSEMRIDPRRSLLVDDNLAALAAAREFGIRFLLAIRQPDSRQPERQVLDFPSVRGFSELRQYPIREGTRSQLAEC